MNIEYFTNTLIFVLKVQKAYIYLLLLSYLIEKTEMFSIFWTGILKTKKKKDDIEGYNLLHTVFYLFFNFIMLLIYWFSNKLPMNFNFLLWVFLTIIFVYSYYKIHNFFQLYFASKMRRKGKKK